VNFDASNNRGKGVKGEEMGSRSREIDQDVWERR